MAAKKTARAAKKTQSPEANLVNRFNEIYAKVSPACESTDAGFEYTRPNGDVIVLPCIDEYMTVRFGAAHRGEDPEAVGYALLELLPDDVADAVSDLPYLEGMSLLLAWQDTTGVTMGE